MKNKELKAEEKERRWKQRLVSRQDAAEILGGIHVRTVDKMIERKQIKAVRIGDRVMLVLASIDALTAA